MRIGKLHRLCFINFQNTFSFVISRTSKDCDLKLKILLKLSLNTDGIKIKFDGFINE